MPESRKLLHLVFNGQIIPAYEGETVAAALHTAGIRSLRRSARLAAPRGVFCSMGICFDCLVRWQGHAQRACLLQVQEGMQISFWEPEPPQ